MLIGIKKRMIVTRDSSTYGAQENWTREDRNNCDSCVPFCHVLLHVPVSAEDENDGPCKKVFSFTPQGWVFNFGEPFMKNVLLRKYNTRNCEINGVL